MCKIAEGLTNAEAMDREAAIIKAIGRWPDGPLVNLSPGGDSGIRETLIGRKRSPETCARIGASKRGIKQTPEHIAKRTAKQIDRKVPAHIVEKSAAKRRGVKRPALPFSQRSKISASLRVTWRSRRTNPNQMEIGL